MPTMDDDEAFERLTELFEEKHGRSPINGDEIFLFGMELDDAALAALGFRDRHCLQALFEEAASIQAGLIPPNQVN